jgi:serine/threonine-protein kinase
MATGSIVDGKYRLEAELGRGGMGIVYSARHTLSQRRVALKLLDPELQSSEEMRQRFLREAEALGRIEHPNVVTVLDVGTSATSSYLVMELLRGEPLRTYLARIGRLESNEAIMLLLPVVSGIEAAHRVGVVHRDLKPENLFVARPPLGERPALRILDFGVAKLDGGSTASPLASSPQRLAIGTPRYMSPEQVRGDCTDERTDVWGLGSLLYELIAGRAPFALSGEARLFDVISREAPPAIETMAPDVPMALARQITRALSQRPSDRHASALAFGVEVAACVGLRFRAPRRPSSPGLHMAIADTGARPSTPDTAAATKRVR